MGSQRLSWKGVAKLQTDICTRLTDDDIKVIVAAGLENLEELKLMECPGITVSALHTLAATSLPKLRRVWQAAGASLRRLLTITNASGKSSYEWC
jgi:hypothetical protein